MLAGLIFAREDAVDAPGSLRACVALTGRTVIEAQAARLRGAGCSRLFVVAARVPSDLSAAVDRIGRSELPVELVRQAAELGDRLPAAARMLVLADGVLPDEMVLRTLLRHPAPVLATSGTGGRRPRIERIDADTHWAGVALIDAALVDTTLAMLGEWELQSTLLRRAAQADAALVPPDGASGEADIDLIDGPAAAARFGGARVGRAGRTGGAVVDRLARRWIATPLIARLQHRGARRGWLSAGAVVTGLVAAAGLSAGWSRAGTVLLVLAAVGALAATMWAGVDESGREAVALDRGARIAVPVALVAAAWGIDPVPWPPVVAAIALLALGERAGMRAIDWAPTPLAVALLLLLAGLAGVMLWGLIAIVLLSLAALAMAIERLRASAPGRDG